MKIMSNCYRLIVTFPDEVAAVKFNNNLEEFCFDDK
jgi:hypothetical protein